LLLILKQLVSDVLVLVSVVEVSVAVDEGWVQTQNASWIEPTEQPESGLLVVL
jgi:hypothetical protein